VVSRCVLSLGRSTTRPAGFRWILSRSLASLKSPASIFSPLDTFHERHIGPDDPETAKMLRRLGYMKMNTFIGDTVPPNVTVPAHHVDMPALSESELHERVKELAAMNKPFKSYIGMGYHNAVVPPVILRNVSSVALVAYFIFNIQIGDGKPCMVHPLYSVPAGNRSRYIHYIPQATNLNNH